MMCVKLPSILGPCWSKTSHFERSVLSSCSSIQTAECHSKYDNWMLDRRHQMSASLKFLQHVGFINRFFFAIRASDIYSRVRFGMIRLDDECVTGAGLHYGGFIEGLRSPLSLPPVIDRLWSPIITIWSQGPQYVLKNWRIPLALVVFIFSDWGLRLLSAE